MLKYYRLTELDVMFGQVGPTTITVLAHVANRQDQLELAIRSYITDCTIMMWEMEEVQPTEPITYVSQPYENGLSISIDRDPPGVGVELVDVLVDLDWPREWVVCISLFGHENDNDINNLITLELDKFLPIQITTTIK